MSDLRVYWLPILWKQRRMERKEGEGNRKVERLGCNSMAHTLSSTAQSLPVLYFYWVTVSFLKVKLFFVLRKAKCLLTVDIFSKLMGKL